MSASGALDTPSADRGTHAPVPAPNLFLVGAPRAGTTALHGYLGQHPDVFLPEVKEPHFFCSDLMREGDAFHGRPRYFPYRTLEQYLALFAGAGGARVIGEASVMYLASTTAAQQIAAFAPHARIIAMVREPVDLLFSLWAKLRALGDESCASFAGALALEDARRQGRDLPPAVRLPSFLYYSDAVRYTEQLERYRACFPPAQLRVIVFDDFRADPARVWADVLAFLDLRQVPLPSHAETNATERARSQRLVLWQRTLEEQRQRARGGGGIGAAIAARVLGRLQWAIHRVNWAPARYEPPASDLRRRLMQTFRPEVVRLSAWLGRDLVGEWGYDAV